MSNTAPLTPRFYCDWVNWLITTGKMATTDITDNLPNNAVDIESGSSLIEMFDMKPSNLQTITADTANDQIQIKINTNIGTDASQESSFVAIYGHNFNQAGVKFKFQYSDTSGFTAGNVKNPALTEVVNIGGDVAKDSGTDPTDGNYATPANNGWSLFTFSAPTANQYMRLVIDASGASYTSDIKIGYIAFGKFIDMPFAPDINIKRAMSEDEGAILRDTDGGMAYSSLKYLSAPNWFLAPYELGTTTTPDTVRRAGRLGWDLNFSFIADTDFTPSTWSSGNILQGDTVHNILQYTVGSHLPFLYQWDNSSTGAYDFCLSRVFRKPDTMQTNNVWSIGMRIVENY